MSTFTIITENNATPPSGVAINALGSDAFTNFSEYAGSPVSAGLIGNDGDKIFDTVSRILYIYNGIWVAIAFVTA
jgi:hypothetical protein